MRGRHGWNAVLGVVLACQSGGATGPGAAPLEQVVRLSPVAPARGDVLTISSTIRNRGAVPIDLSSRICGLDLSGDLSLSGSLLMCAGYAQQVTLMPTDSVTTFDARVVASGPGRYTLRVRHALAPERWVEVSVVVR